MEWGLLNYVKQCFNFGLKFRKWVYMLFTREKTCIKTNGLLSKWGKGRGRVPEKYKKEVNDLIWKFIWHYKPNQIEINVCCLNINEGGWG